MGHGIKLTPDQWDELDRVRFTTDSADVFRNCLIILMSDSRDTIASIAQRLGCAPDTVNRVRRLYRSGGVAALRPGKSTGRPPKVTPEFIAQMNQAARTDPQTLGYGFSVWSAARLAAHLAKVTGIRFSDEHLRRILVRHGFSFQRPKHTMKGKRDETAYEKARKKLVRLKKTP
jgi:transposase